jgi:hypothetical protein
LALSSGRIFVFCIAILLANPAVSVAMGKSSTPQFVTFTLMVNSETFDQLAQNLTIWQFHNFTFCIDPMNNGGLWYLQNETRKDMLNAYGEIIPVWGYTQLDEPEARVKSAKVNLDAWIQYTGRLPNGIFMFQPDTLLVRLAESLGIKYVVGGLQDQYLVDWMTEMGSYQLPYYASLNNSLIPENTTSRGIIMLPSISSDIVDSYTIDYFLSTHPVGNNQEMRLTAQYIIGLVAALNSNCEPFGYVSYYFEYDWLYDLNKANFATKILADLIADSSVQHPTLAQFSDWFKANYESTPTYRQSFIAPSSKRTAEVFFNKDFRIQRIDGDKVVIYVDYNKQPADPYLLTKSNFTMLKEPSESNCVWTVTNFGIYAVGGGIDRAPVKNNSTAYSGDLSSFPSYNSESEDHAIIIYASILFVFLLALGLIIISRKAIIKYKTKSQSLFLP